jgi:alkanesulfonate monooxygenase SsuD/methylene tetrahydromethanopterin reductase-like flavin-dependent oxidoreductase (luciferase family)
MKTVKFGWRVPAFPVDGSRGATFIDQITGTLSQIQARFDSAWVADHFLPWANFQSDDTDTLECFTTMSYLAGAFPGLHFGSIVLSQSYRNPALLAKMGATLQALSGGRFILGIGAGWKEDEYRAYGYEFPRTPVRIAQLEEAVQIIRRLWTEAPADFTGKYYRIQAAHCEPRPQPRPTILIGGGGEKLTLRIVAKHADWWNFPGGSVENYAHKLDVLRGHCQAVGRDFDQIVKTWAAEVVAVAATESQAKRVAEASPFYQGSGIVGDPQQVAAQLRTFVDLGVEHFILRFADFPDPDGALLFAEEVIPQLR